MMVIQIISYFLYLITFLCSSEVLEKGWPFFVIKAFENISGGYPKPCGNCSIGFQYPSAYCMLRLRVLATTSEKIYIIFESC
jgi:hypothetical protein